MAEYPLFFETNRISNNTDEINASTGDGVVENAFDYTNSTKWESSGSDDTTAEYIDVIFQDADGNKVTRSIDRMIVINNNLKAFKLQKNNWNGIDWDGWVDVSGTEFTNNSDSTVVVTITEFSTHRVRLYMTTTQVADEEKELDQFIVTQSIYESTMPMDVYNIKYKSKTLIQRLYDGTAQKIHHYTKYAATVEFRQITQTELDALKDIYDDQVAFLFMPEPYDENGDYYKAEECYRVLWTSSWEQRYFTTVKSAGHNVRIMIEEV